MAADFPVPESPTIRKCIASRSRGTQAQRLRFLWKILSGHFCSSLMNDTPSGAYVISPFDWPSFSLNSAVVTSSGPRNLRPCLYSIRRARSFGTAANNSTNEERQRVVKRLLMISQASHDRRTPRGSSGCATDGRYRTPVTHCNRAMPAFTPSSVRRYPACRSTPGTGSISSPMMKLRLTLRCSSPPANVYRADCDRADA